MKFVVEKSILQKSLTNIVSIIPAKVSYRIAENVMLETTSDGILATTTNMDITAQAFFPAQVEVQGSILIPAKRFNDIVKILNGDISVSISQQGNSNEEGEENPFEEQGFQCEIKAGKRHFSLPASAVNDFPTLLKPEGNENAVEILPESLKKAIEKVGFAASNEQVQTIFNGILWEAGEEEQVLVATDKKLLSAYTIKTPLGEGTSLRNVFPQELFFFLSRLIDEDEAPMHFQFAQKSVYIKYKEYKVFSRLFEGNFPNYRDIIPQNNDTIARIPVKELLQAIKAVSLMTDSMHYAVKLHFQPGKLNIQASSREAGFAEEDLEIEYEGGSLEIGFSYKYLLAILEKVEEEEAVFHLGNEQTAALVRREAEDFSQLFLVMPMKIS